MLDLGLLAFLARRTLLHSRLTLVLLVGAVAAAVGIQIPNTANLVGYTAELIEHGVTRGQGDVRVSPANGARFSDGNAIATQIMTVDGVREALPVVSLPGVVGKGDHAQVSQVIGLDCASPYRPFVLQTGALLASGDRDGLLLGTALASRLHANVGDTIDMGVLLPPPPNASPDDVPTSYMRQPMIVRGVVSGSFGAYESTFVDRALLAKSMGEPNAATRILVYAGGHARDEGISAALRAEPKRAEGIAEKIRQIVPNSSTVTWDEDTPYLKSAIRSNEILGAVSHTMVIVAVTIPLWALSYINVMHRRRDIALLSAMGFTRGDVFIAFILQALAIGIIGAAFGMGLGYAIVSYFSAHPIFDSDGFTVRPVISARGFYEPVMVVVGATVLAALLPARSASRVDPARVLRGVE